jgi:hypothetical protein
MDTIDVENVDQKKLSKMKMDEKCIESAPSTVPSIAHVDSVEDVAGINGTIAELIVSCLLKLPFKSVPALKNLMSPGECVKLKPNALSYDRRLDMPEYACSKEDSGDISRNSYACCLVQVQVGWFHHAFITDSPGRLVE